MHTGSGQRWADGGDVSPARPRRTAPRPRRRYRQARRLHSVLTDRSDTARLETHCSPRRAGLDARGTEPLLLSEAGGPCGFLSADSPQLKRTALPTACPFPEQLLRGWCGPTEAGPGWAGLTMASEGRPGLRVPASRAWRSPPPAAQSCCFDSSGIEGTPLKASYEGLKS